ncbi:MAG: serine kinase [Armatimonadetes bacterium]|nr:serine kinase [Armatimonadota bacterium]
MEPPQPVTVGRAVEALDLGTCVSADPEALIAGAQVSDLLSYVMAEGQRGQVWVTIQTHPNIVAVAGLAGMHAIIIAGGFEPEPETIARAEEEGMGLFTSAQTAYLLAGKLYELGVR